MKERKKLREVADRFLNAVKEEVDSAVLLGDADRLGRLVTQVDILLGYEVLETLRDKGLKKKCFGRNRCWTQVRYRCLASSECAIEEANRRIKVEKAQT